MHLEDEVIMRMKLYVFEKDYYLVLNEVDLFNDEVVYQDKDNLLIHKVKICSYW